MLRGGSTRRRLFPFALALAAGVGSAALVGLSSSQATTPAQNITGNQTLVAGQELESSGGQYVLLLASNGNLEESFNGGQVVWKTTGGAKGDHALLQPNGNLVLISSTGQTLWSSNSAGTGCPSLDLQRDGNLVIYDPSTPAAFTKGLVDKLPSGQKLEPGWLLYAPNGFYYVEMQTDGNLVLRNDVGTALWSSGTAGNAGAYAILQTDGNFVVYSAAGKALWSTDTTGDNGATLEMQDDGNLVLYTTSGAAPWSSKTHDAANSGKDVDPAGPAGSTKPCPAPAPAPTPTRTVTTPPTIMTVTPPPVDGSGPGSGSGSERDRREGARPGAATATRAPESDRQVELERRGHEDGPPHSRAFAQRHELRRAVQADAGPPSPRQPRRVHGASAAGADPLARAQPLPAR